jgi:plastocyanin
MQSECFQGGRTGRLTRTLVLTAIVGIMAAAPLRSATAASIRIENFSFVPAILTVPVGTTVTWENADDIPHSIVLADKSFHSKPLDTHDSVGFQFAKPGEVTYFCGLHPHMEGKIVVVP